MRKRRSRSPAERLRSLAWLCFVRGVDPHRVDFLAHSFAADYRWWDRVNGWLMLWEYRYPHLSGSRTHA